MLSLSIVGVFHANVLLVRAYHVRNKFQPSLGYDFEALVKKSPSLAAYVIPKEQSKSGRATIDFHAPSAVSELNKALLMADYDVRTWALPPSTLTPTVPGRANYIHLVADVLAETCGTGGVPIGENVRMLDIGTGASVVYPIIARVEYGWSCVGTENNLESYKWARSLISQNRHSSKSSQGATSDGDALSDAGDDSQPGNDLSRVEVRFQQTSKIFHQVVDANADRFDIVISNPPFYPSAEAYLQANARKVSNLARNLKKRNEEVAGTPPRGARGSRKEKGEKGAGKGASLASSNCRGVDSELWCPGGELAFIQKMIKESERLSAQILWFSSLVSKEDNLAPLRRSLEQTPGVADTRVCEMSTGNKATRVLLWTYKSAAEREAWARHHWREYME
jgi:23S rRNA (adenine1618-N6)-methyltransferase